MPTHSLYRRTHESPLHTQALPRRGLQFAPLTFNANTFSFKFQWAEPVPSSSSNDNSTNNTPGTNTSTTNSSQAQSPTPNSFALEMHGIFVISLLGQSSRSMVFVGLVADRCAERLAELIEAVSRPDPIAQAQSSRAVISPQANRPKDLGHFHSGFAR